MRIAVQGAGRWGRNWVRVLNELLGPENVLVCDLRNCACRFKENADYGQVMKSVPYDQVDAVVIATPTEGHFTHALEALNEGTHVMVEKPMALSSYHALKMTAHAEMNDAVLMTNHLMLVHPAYTKIKSLLEAGAIGDVIDIQAERFGATPRSCGVVWTMAPHDVSMLVDLFGVPSVVRGSDVGPEATVKMFWEEGIGAQAYLDYNDTGARLRMMFINGTEGVLDLRENELWLDEDLVDLPPQEPLKLMAEAFIRSCREGEAEVASGESALEVIEVIERWHKD